MISILTARPGSARFRLRWLGYDRAQVDAFLRQTAAERQKLQEDLAQLEVVMAGHSEERRRELERLTTLRAEVASCLETSIGALRTATDRLAASGQPGVPQPAAGSATRTAPRSPSGFPGRSPRVALRLPTLAIGWLPKISLPHGRRAVAAGVVVAAIIPAVLYRSSAREMPAANSGAVAASPRQPVAAAATQAIAAVDQHPGVVLSLTGRRECWLSMKVDGGEPFERMLRAGETIILRANQEAVLRVGDASALSALINNDPAKPLGGDGQVVTVRITPENYRTFLAVS